MAVKHFCDRCGEELSETSPTFAQGLYPDPYFLVETTCKTNGRGKLVTADLCRVCIRTIVIDPQPVPRNECAVLATETVVNATRDVSGSYAADGRKLGTEIDWQDPEAGL